MRTASSPSPLAPPGTHGPMPVTHIDDDTRLMRLAADGDDRAVAELVRRHIDAVTAWLRKRSSADVAEDVAHDAFLPKRLANFNGDSAVRTYLIGVARNLLMHRQRDDARERKRGVQSLDRLRADGVEPVDPRTTGGKLPGDQLDDVVERVFAELSEREQRVFHLRYRKGLEFAEIAVLTGIDSENTVRSMHRRALLRLRQTLGSMIAGLEMTR